MSESENVALTPLDVACARMGEAVDNFVMVYTEHGASPRIRAEIQNETLDLILGMIEARSDPH